MQNRINFDRRKYKSLRVSLETIFREEGFLTLWKGTVPGLALWGVYSGVQFPVYKETKMLMKKYANDDVGSFLSGAFAGLLATLVSYPFDTLRTRRVSFNKLQPNYKLGIWDLVRVIGKMEGIQGFYAGLGPTVAQVIPNIGLTFYFYEKISLVKLVSKDVDYIFRGGIAGFLAKCITFPLDTVKKRMQMHGSTENIPIFRSSVQCAKVMLQNEGLMDFIKESHRNFIKLFLHLLLHFILMKRYFCCWRLTTLNKNSAGSHLLLLNLKSKQKTRCNVNCERKISIYFFLNMVPFTQFSKYTWFGVLLSFVCLLHFLAQS
eukprot:snap_masked-scaffold_39-processed-gene-0.1-mRNA-1 protein AED:0.31 eAED:0.31 QI:0/0/0/0.33/1/1/3/0/318